MTMERLFVAIPLGEEQRKLLQKQQQRLSENVPFQKWTHPQDLHITLKFLGETPSHKMDSILQLLQHISSAHTSFQLTLRGLGTFGKPSSPSILWAGVHGELEPLSVLQKEVESAVEPLGFEREQRSYSPHITLARRYQGTSGLTPTALSPYNVIDTSNEATWTVSSLALYRTHLGRKPSYEQAAAFELK